MENFTLKSPYFHLLLLLLRFNLFKTPVSAIHLNSLKMPITKIHKGLHYFFINDAITEGQWGCLIINVLQVAVYVSCFSKKYHNHDTFTLAIGLIILALWHLIYVLSNWKFRSRFLPDLVGICNFSRKITYLSMIGVYVHHIWLSLIIIRLNGDIEEMSGPRCKSNQSFSICHWNLNSITAHNYLKISLLRAYISLYNLDVVCISETYLDSTTAFDDENLAFTEYHLLKADHASNSKRGSVCAYYKNSLALRLIDVHYLQECLISEILIGGKSCNFISLFR